MVYCLLGVAVMAATIVAVYVAPSLVADTSVVRTVQLLIFITGLSLAMEFPFKAYAGTSSYHMRYDLISIARILISLVSVAVTVVLVLSGYSVVAVAVVGFFSSIATNVVFYTVQRRLEPELRFRRDAISSATFKELTTFSLWSFLADTLKIIRLRSGLWLSGAMLGNVILATYYAAVRLVDYAAQLLGSALGMTNALFAREFGESGKAQSGGKPAPLRAHRCRRGTGRGGWLPDLCRTIFRALGGPLAGCAAVRPPEPAGDDRVDDGLRHNAAQQRAERTE